MSDTRYPVHEAFDKLPHQVPILEFLRWLNDESPYVLALIGDGGVLVYQDPAPVDLFAEYHGLDVAALQAERRSIIKETLDRIPEKKP